MPFKNSLINATGDYIAQVNATHSLDDLLRIFQQQIEHLGFSQFTYWVIWPPFGPRKPLYISSYRKDFSKHYIDNDFKNIDAVWHRAIQQITPFSWSEITHSRSFNDTHKVVFNEARDFKIASGATVPLYGPGQTKAAVSVACDIEQADFDKLYQQSQIYLHFISTYLHQRIVDIITASDDTTRPPLTAREREVLLWTARGKTNWDIGHILMIAENTVRNHIQNICRKYDVSNKTQAVAQAIINGDITL